MYVLSLNIFFSFFQWFSPLSQTEESDSAGTERHTSTSTSTSSTSTGYQDFNTVFTLLMHAWILVEIRHRVSKEASSAFWDVANKFFPLLFHARRMEKITRKIPQFRHLRAKLYQKHVPRISIEYGYENKKTGEITIVKDQICTPKKRFPPSKYHQLYEIASISVIINTQFLI